MSTAVDEPSIDSGLRRDRRAILVVDLVESVRLLQSFEVDVIGRWRRDVMAARDEVLPAHGGRMVKSLGDGLLAVFAEPRFALAAAQEMQHAIQALNADRPAEAHLWLRMGLHVAEVIVDEIDVFGSGVNTAARIAALAPPGEIWLSVEARDAVADGLDAELHDRGECWVKHIDHPLRVYSARPADTAASPAMQVLRDEMGIGVTVMPFIASTASAESLPLADLLGDQVSAALSRSSHLRVVSRWSTQRVAARASEPRDVGRLLGVDYLVSGRLTAIGPAVHLQAELVECASGSVVWAGSHRSELPDILAGQDAIVHEVASSVSWQIVERELNRSAGMPMPTLDSHRLLMTAVGLIHRCAPHDFARAAALLEALAERHSRLAQPQAWLAHWHAMNVVQGHAGDPQLAAKRAWDHARRALNANAQSSIALTMTGLVCGFLMHDLEAADDHYAAALEINPNEPLTWLYKATLRAWQDRGAEALESARRALALAPHDPMRYYYESLAGLAALVAGETELARELSARSLRAHGRHTSTHRTLAVAQWKLGQEADARATVQAMLRVEPSFTTEGYLSRFPGGRSRLAVENAEILALAGAPLR